MGKPPVQGLVVHIVVLEVSGEAGMAEALHVLKEGIQILLVPEHIVAVLVHIEDVPAVLQSENDTFWIVVHRFQLLAEALSGKADGLAEVSQTVEGALSVAGKDLFLG